MTKLFKKLDSVRLKLIPSIPDQYMAEYQIRTFEENYKRIRIFISILLVWFTVLLISDFYFIVEFNSLKGYGNFIYLDLFTVGFLLIQFFLFQHKLPQKKEVCLKVTSRVIDASILFMLCDASVITSYETDIILGMPTYIIAVFVVGSAFYMSSLKILVFYLISLLLLISLLFIKNEFNAAVFMQNIAVVALILLAWVNSQIIHRGRVRNYLKEKDLIESNNRMKAEMKIRMQTEIELQNAKLTLEKRVEERTTDLKKAVSKLLV